MSSPENAWHQRDDDAIEDIASQWLVERAEGLSPERARAFEQWRRADPRHAEALDRMEQTQALLTRLPFAADRLADIRRDADVHASHPRPRSATAWRALGGLAAAVAVAALAWWQWPARTLAPTSVSADPVLRYATASGGYERAVLDDGSTLELNADTEVRVDFTATERRVTLLSGEAHFTVSRDPERPFVVTAGSYSVRAVGTAFNVRFAPVEVEVTVTEGKVLVSPKESPPSGFEPAEHKPLVTAGQRVVIAAGSVPSAQKVETVAPAAMRAALAWQERRLVFADTPLREVVLQFNQRNRTQLVLGDSALGDKLVGGTFASDNVDAFVRLLENSGDIVFQHRAEHEIVLYRAR